MNLIMSTISGSTDLRQIFSSLRKKARKRSIQTMILTSGTLIVEFKTDSEAYIRLLLINDDEDSAVVYVNSSAKITDKQKIRSLRRFLKQLKIDTASTNNFLTDDRTINKFIEQRKTKFDSYANDSTAEKWQYKKTLGDYVFEGLSKLIIFTFTIPLRILVFIMKSASVTGSEPIQKQRATNSSPAKKSDRKEYVKKRSGETIGIMIYHANGDVTGQSRSGKQLCVYRANSDETRHGGNGSFLYRGNNVRGVVQDYANKHY